MRLRLPNACRIDCTLCAGAVPAEDEGLMAVLRHAEQTDQLQLYLQGTDLVRDPRLRTIIERVRAHTRRIALVENGRGLDLPGAARWLRQMEVECVYLSLPGTEAPGDEEGHGTWKQAAAVLLALRRAGHVPVGVHLALTQRSAAQLTAILRLQAHLAVRELLISEVSDANGAFDGPRVVATLERVWLAANAAQVRVRIMGFERTHHVNRSVGPPAPTCDPALVDIVRQRIPLPSVRSGIHALGATAHPSGLEQIVRSPEALRTLGLEMAARCCPFVDLPPCLGGVQLTRPTAIDHQPIVFTKSDACRTCEFDTGCPGASDRIDVKDIASLHAVLRPLPTWYAFPRPPRVLILWSEGHDPISYVSTIPGLAHALNRRGACVESVLPGRAPPWNPAGLPPVVRIPTSPGGPQDTSCSAAWLARHRLDEFDLVITSDFPTARLALATGSLRVSTRVVVIDFHMLNRMDEVVAEWVAPGARAADGGWWPSEQLIVESAFPGYVKLYLNYGVPLEQLTWRPYALCPAHFPPGPDVHEGDVIFSGGNHLRDLETLRLATERLPASVHRIDLYAPGERVEGNAHLRHHGIVELPAFYRALTQSRFAVVPLREETNNAAGITVIVMALMAGRPIIATGTVAVRDYVRHGTEGLLVPPGDADALADAITRLDTDPALLSALAAGAREAGRRLSTEHWAEQIVSGGRPFGPLWTAMGWRNW